jgi:hypothetical protein
LGEVQKCAIFITLCALGANAYGMKRIPEVCGNLVKSMPRRIEGVIKPKGGQMRCR